MSLSSRTAPLTIVINQTGVQGVSGAQLSVAGQSYTAPSNLAGIGFNPSMATMLFLQLGQGLATFQVFNQQSSTSAPVIQPFYGSSGTLGLPTGQHVRIRNSTPYSVLFAIGTPTSQLSTPLPAIVNPGGVISFTLNTSATSIAISGSASSPTHPQPPGTTPPPPPAPTPTPTTPASKLKTWQILLIVAAVLLVLALLGGLLIRSQRQTIILA